MTGCRNETWSAIKDECPQRCAKWLARIREYGRDGVTRDELSSELNIPVSEFSGRISELLEVNQIVKTDRTRTTRRGRNASVIVAVEFAGPEECQADTSELQEAIKHHLLREPRPIDQGTLSRELEKLSVAVEAIPTAPQWEWMHALESLIESGDVVAAGRRVAINQERVSEPQGQAQGMLF